MRVFGITRTPVSRFEALHGPTTDCLSLLGADITREEGLLSTREQ